MTNFALSGARALALGTALTGLAGAQDPGSDIQPPPGGAPITDIVREDGAAVRWLSSYDEVPLYTDMACTQVAPASGGYLEEYFEVFRGDDQVLLGRSDDPAGGKVSSLAGWAKQDDLLRSRTNAYRCLRTATGVQRKALIVHKWEKGSERQEAAILRTQPHDFAPETVTMRLYEILFVYDVRGEDPEDPSAGYSLLGTRPYASVGVEPADTFQGWISNRRIFFWDHREAWEYNKTSEALRGRAEAGSPIRMFIDPVDVEEGRAAFEEDLEQGPWNYYQQRFPIVEHRPTQIAGEDYYKIGVIGDSYAGGEVVTTKSVEDAIRLHIEELRSGIQSLDVLIVLDATGSMSKFYASIADSIQRIQESIEKDRDAPIRYGVLYYRDYTEESDPDSWSYYYRDFMDADSFRALFDEDSPEYVASRGGDDNPPPFFAVDTAVRTVTWKPDSMRAVILIGDMGNEADDPRGYTQARVVESLKEFDCSFFAIQAQPSTSHDRIQQYDRQAEGISTALAMPVTEVMDANGTDLSAALTSNIETSIQHIAILEDVLQRLQTGEGLGDAVVQSLQELGLGHLLDPEGGLTFKGERTGTFITQRVQEMLKEKGHDPDLFAAARIQHFGYAYAAKQPTGSREPWFLTRVLMSRAECQSLAGTVLGRLQRTPLTNQNVDQVWRGIVNSLSGDFEDELSFDEDTPLSTYVTMALGIPLRSPYLSLSVRQLKDLPPRELAEWQEQIDLHYQQLTNFLHDKRIDGSGTERHFFPMHGVDFAWVPLEILP